MLKINLLQPKGTPMTTMTALRLYHDAYESTKQLKADHDVLVAGQAALLPLINKAEAEENKAREAMLLVIQGNDKQ